MRRTILDHLQMFADCRRPLCIYYLNTAFGYPATLKESRFDLLVLHPTWLAAARHPLLSENQLFKQAGVFRDIAHHRIALPQDEHHNFHRLTRIFMRLGIHHVFSVAPPDCLHLLYGRMDSSIHLHTIRTGCISTDTLQAISGILRESNPRTIDIGYRATRTSPRLGRHGKLKHEIAVMVENAARARGLTTDISTDLQDTFLDLDWYRFLARCRYTIGVEGGSSVPDPDGRIAQSVQDFLRNNQGADFFTVEKNCFPTLDGTLPYFAMSPRQLEAAATKTGQILIRGNHGGLLQPDHHYLPLNEDFSNLESILDQLRDDNLRSRLTESAWNLLIKSGLCGSELLADSILDRLPLLDRCNHHSLSQEDNSWLLNREAELRKRIPSESFLYQLGQRFLPDNILERLRYLYRKA